VPGDPRLRGRDQRPHRGEVEVAIHAKAQRRVGEVPCLDARAQRLARDTGRQVRHVHGVGAEARVEAQALDRNRGARIAQRRAANRQRAGDLEPLARAHRPRHRQVEASITGALHAAQRGQVGRGEEPQQLGEIEPLAAHLEIEDRTRPRVVHRA